MEIPTYEESNLLRTNICQALGDPKRILILYALSESPHYVTALSEVLDLPQPTVSRHLSMLRQRSLVKCERNGTAMVYRIADERIMDVLETMRGLLRDIVDEAARSLET